MGKVNIVIFPDEYIELNQEAARHPRLALILQTQPLEDMEVRIAEIAAYCEVVLDGVFTQKELRSLCHTLIMILKAKGTEIILPFH